MPHFLSTGNLLASTRPAAEKTRYHPHYAGKNNSTERWWQWHVTNFVKRLTRQEWCCKGAPQLCIKMVYLYIFIYMYKMHSKYCRASDISQIKNARHRTVQAGQCTQLFSMPHVHSAVASNQQKNFWRGFTKAKMSPIAMWTEWQVAQGTFTTKTHDPRRKADWLECTAESNADTMVWTKALTTCFWNERTLISTAEDQYLNHSMSNHQTSIYNILLLLL